MLLTLQQALMAACYGDPAGYAAALPHLAGGAVAADKALYIHTATVTAALTGVLAQAYPAVADRLGEEAFAAAARDFLRRHPPGMGVLSAYGDGFAAGLPPALQPLAAADWAAQRAYFAADAAVLDATALSALPPDRLAGLSLPLVPAAAVINGPAAVWQDWAARRPDIVFPAPPLPVPAGPAVLLVWRGPDLRVAAVLLPGGTGPFLTALRDGTPLLAAAALLDNPDIFPPLLALLLSHGVLAATPPTVTP